VKGKSRFLQKLRAESFKLSDQSEMPKFLHSGFFVFPKAKQGAACHGSSSLS
jgi:hypothetical protein